MSEAFGSEEERVGGRQSVSDLLQWALDLGARLSPSISLQLQKTESVCLYRCVSDVHQGQELFRIPEGVLLRSDSAGKWRDHLLGIPDIKYGDGDNHLSERDRLSLRLLLESCDDESHWKPYIQALPKEQPCLSAWDKETLEVDLKHTPIWKSTRAFKSNLDIVGEPSAALLECCHSLVSPTLSAEMRSKATKAQIRWCHQMVLSRAFGIRKDESEDPFPTLVPVVDLLDHSNDAKVSWSLKKKTDDTDGDGDISAKRHFHFVCDKPLAKDSQLFTNYGGKGNEELLRGYGFTLEDNPFDFYIIELGIGGNLSGGESSSSDPNLEGDPTEWSLRVDLLQRMKCKKTHALTYKDPLPVGLLAAATVAILPQQDIHFLHTHHDRRTEAERGEEGAPGLDKWLACNVGHLHVLKALKMLRHQIESALGKMCEVATIEDDEAELYTYSSYSCEKSFRRLVAIHYRLGLKRILREARGKVRQSASAIVRENMILSPSSSTVGGNSNQQQLQLLSQRLQKGYVMPEIVWSNGSFQCIAEFYKSELPGAKQIPPMKALGLFFERGVKADTKVAEVPIFVSSCMLSDEETLGVERGLDSFSPNDKEDFLQLISLEHLLLGLAIHKKVQTLTTHSHDDRTTPALDLSLQSLWKAIESGHHQTLKMIVGSQPRFNNGNVAHGLQFGNQFETWAYLRERFISLVHFLRRECIGLLVEDEIEEESKSKRQKVTNDDPLAFGQHMDDTAWAALCIALDFGKVVPPVEQGSKKRCVLAPVLDCVPADSLDILFKLTSSVGGAAAGRIDLYSMCDIPADSYFGVLLEDETKKGKEVTGTGAEEERSSSVSLLHPIQKFAPYSNTDLIERFGIAYCYAGNEHQCLELDLGALKSDPISPYKTKLMVALSLPRVHYLRKRQDDRNHEKGLKDVEVLCVCISLICIKVEKLVKLGSDKLLKTFDAYQSNQYRLQDKMHHYQTSLPLDEKQVYESEKALVTKRKSLLKRLRSSARHEQIIKQASFLLEKSSNLEKKGDLSACLDFQVSTLAAIREHFKDTLLKEFAKPRT